jgi:hypothetical protein
MSTWPSQDGSIQKQIPGSFFQGIEDIFDNIVKLDSLPRRNWNTINKSYIRERKFDEFCDLSILNSRVPDEIVALGVGPKDIDLISFLINCSGVRSLILDGPRGSGKSSMLNFVESAIIESGYQLYPIFITVDCLSDDRNITKEELIVLLKQELIDALDFVNDKFKKCFREAIEILNGDSTFAAARSAFRYIYSKLPPEQFNRIVVVFDNMDQNFIQSVTYAVELAKELNISSNTATIVALRPGCLQGLFERGDARAFFNYKIKITAPKTISWISKISESLVQETGKLLQRTKKPLIIHGRKIKPKEIKSAFDNLIDLLKGRREEDDVLQILDAAAADDLRHLLFLFRRLLSSRKLPSRWMLNIDDQYPGYYHPLISMFEGQYLIFSNNKAVPNLLSFFGSNGRCDFFISQRILLLLGTNTHQHPLKTTKLIKLLMALGHKEDTIIACLKYTYEFLLIRSTNAEFFDPDGTLPDHVFLTEAGNLYITKLLNTADYLLTIVMDIRLKHEEYKAVCRSDCRNVPFPVSIDSLIEYAHEVAILEEAQINYLLNQPMTDDNLNIIDTLRKGGLFSIFMRNGLEDIYYRSKLSDRMKKSDLLPVMNEVGSIIRDLNQLIQNLEQILTDAYLISIGNGPNIEKEHKIFKNHDLIFETIGTDIEITAKIKTYRECNSALICIFGEIENKRIALSTIASTKQCIPGSSISATFEKLPNLVGADFDNVKPHAILDVCKLGRRVGLLTTDTNNGETIHLNFHVVNSDGVGCRIFDIGKDVKINDINKISKEIYQEISPPLLQKKLDFSLLQIQGNKLANTVLTEEGQNVLASHFELIDTLVLFAADEDIIIPWEIIRPKPIRDHIDVPTIRQKWRVIRWPTSTKSDVIDAMTKINMLEDKIPIGNLLTIAEKNPHNLPHVIEPPSDVSELPNLVADKNTVHLIGHYDRDNATLKIGSLKINLLTYDTFPFLGPTNIIISGCEAAAQNMDKNLLIEISRRSKAATWAPLVGISDDLAHEIDNDIANFSIMGRKSSINDIFIKRANTVPFYNIYTRYGFAYVN